MFRGLSRVLQRIGTTADPKAVCREFLFKMSWFKGLAASDARSGSV